MSKIEAVIYLNDSRVSISESNVKTVGTKFESGVYKSTMTQKGLNISVAELPEVHNLIHTDETAKILDLVGKFIKPESRKIINSKNFLHKLGILLYGNAGTGKTSLLNHIGHKLAEKRDTIVLLANTSNDLVGAMSLAKSIRNIQENLIVIIADEFERWCSDYESEMKSFLDGVESIDNLLFLAATNYIEKIPKTLSERPSRFKIVQEIEGLSNKAEIKRLIREGLSTDELSEEALDNIVQSKPYFTIDEIKHVVLDTIMGTVLGSTSSKRSVGFSTQKDDSSSKDSVSLSPRIMEEWLGSLWGDEQPEVSNTDNL